jgi:predicted TIM-barrel fold metal-dependent hydrolase
MIIDGHAHLILPVESHVALMETAGVERTLLFSTRVHPERAYDLATLNQELSLFNAILAGKVNNDLQSFQQAVSDVAQVIQHYPERFIGFANVPLGLAQKETAMWIEKYVLASNFRGLGEFTLRSGAIDQLEVVFTCASEYGNLPLWIHTLPPLNLEDIHQLIALSQRYPRVPLILGHMGGMYWRETIALAKELPQTYIDLSGTITFLGPKIAIHELPSRTLFSSDAPFGHPLVARTIVEQATKDPTVRRRVLGDNLAELLQLT